MFLTSTSFHQGNCNQLFAIKLRPLFLRNYSSYEGWASSKLSCALSSIILLQSSRETLTDASEIRVCISWNLVNMWPPDCSNLTDTSPYISLKMWPFKNISHLFLKIWNIFSPFAARPARARCSTTKWRETTTDTWRSSPRVTTGRRRRRTPWSPTKQLQTSPWPSCRPRIQSGTSIIQIHECSLGPWHGETERTWRLLLVKLDCYVGYIQKSILAPVSPPLPTELLPHIKPGTRNNHDPRTGAGQLSILLLVWYPLFAGWAWLSTSQCSTMKSSTLLTAPADWPRFVSLISTLLQMFYDWLAGCFRRRDRGAGHLVRGELQGLHPDHAAAAGQPHAVDLRHAGRGRRRHQGRRWEAVTMDATRKCSLASSRILIALH